MKVSTIGFTKKSAEEFFQLIRQSGAQRIVDVRLRSGSQLAGFAKKNDIAWFARELCNIDYVHMPTLAPSKELLDDYRKNGMPWETYETRFLDLMRSRRVERTLSKELVDDGCLLCSEAQPHHCHRRLVAEYLQEHWGPFEVHHLVTPQVSSAEDLGVGQHREASVAKRGKTRTTGGKDSNGRPTRRGHTEKPMRHAVVDLADFPDGRFFEEVSSGIAHIVGNATELDEAAKNLQSAGNHRVGQVLNGMAEEEAAKVLILIDAVRGPTEQRGTTLKRFNDHLAKRIYAATAGEPHTLAFDQLQEFIDRQRRPYFLDGPNDVDWIVGNEIMAERSRGLYVDFLQDTTEPPGEYFWSFPLTYTGFPPPDESPTAVTLARALAAAGATSPEGLTVIADDWRDFRPSQDTPREVLRDRIAQTLTTLLDRGIATFDQAAVDSILSNWNFPLWSLDLSLAPASSPIGDLREYRAAALERMKTVAAVREPAPAIGRETIEAMDRAYAAWAADTDEYDRKTYPHRQGSGIQIRHSSEFRARYRLPSYTRLKARLSQLDANERIALLALANFARDRVPNWPYHVKHATKMVDHLNDDYQVSLGEYWLRGLDLWEADPPDLQVGRFFHH